MPQTESQPRMDMNEHKQSVFREPEDDGGADSTDRATKADATSPGQRDNNATKESVQVSDLDVLLGPAAL